MIKKKREDCIRPLLGWWADWLTSLLLSQHCMFSAHTAGILFLVAWDLIGQ